MQWMNGYNGGDSGFLSHVNLKVSLSFSHTEPQNRTYNYYLLNININNYLLIIEQIIPYILFSGHSRSLRIEHFEEQQHSSRSNGQRSLFTYNMYVGAR